MVLKRDAVARVVLNNLYKHTELQSNFAANMLALVDGVPCTLTLDQFISHWITHQVEVIQAGRAICSARPRSGPTCCVAWSRRSTCLTRSSR